MVQQPGQALMTAGAAQVQQAQGAAAPQAPPQQQAQQQSQPQPPMMLQVDGAGDTSSEEDEDEEEEYDEDDEEEKDKDGGEDGQVEEVSFWMKKQRPLVAVTCRLSEQDGWPTVKESNRLRSVSNSGLSNLVKTEN